MSKTRTGNVRSEPATYDEIHLLHAAEGANIVKPNAAVTWSKVIRRGVGEPYLTLEQIAAAISALEIPPELTAPWTVRDRRVTATSQPRCLKVIFVFSPIDEIDWSKLLKTYDGFEDYFASYASIVPRLELVLPATWAWFTTGRGSAVVPPLTAADALRQRLTIIINRLTLEHGAIRGTGDRFKIERIARACGHRKRTFERRVSAELGRSAADIVRDIRLDIARELLQSSRTVLEVANRVGYTPSHFAKLYQARFAVAPGNDLKR